MDEEEVVLGAHEPHGGGADLRNLPDGPLRQVLRDAHECPGGLRALACTCREMRAQVSAYYLDCDRPLRNEHTDVLGAVAGLMAGVMGTPAAHDKCLRIWMGHDAADRRRQWAAEVYLRNRVLNVVVWFHPSRGQKVLSITLERHHHHRHPLAAEGGGTRQAGWEGPLAAKLAAEHMPALLGDGSAGSVAEVRLEDAKLENVSPVVEARVAIAAAAAAQRTLGCPVVTIGALVRAAFGPAARRAAELAARRAAAHDAVRALRAALVADVAIKPSQSLAIAEEGSGDDDVGSGEYWLGDLADRHWVICAGHVYVHVYVSMATSARINATGDVAVITGAPEPWQPASRKEADEAQAMLMRMREPATACIRALAGVVAMTAARRGAEEMQRVEEHGTTRGRRRDPL